jgi:tetratricopeptide (TPR) repeat protein
MSAQHDYNEAPSEGLAALVAQYESAQHSGKFGYLDLDNYLDIVEFYEQHFFAEKALAVLEKAILLYPFSAQLYIKQAQILLDLDRSQEANDALDKAHSYEPNALDILLTRVEIYNRLQYFDEAHDILEQARQQISEDEDEYMDILLLEAALCESQHQFEPAFDNLYSILKKMPDNEPASVRLRMLLEQVEIDFLTEILPLLQRLVDATPYSHWAWNNLGFALGRLQKTDEALEAFDYAVVIDDNFAFARYDAVDLLMQVERYQEATELLENCLVVFGAHAETFLKLAEAHYELKNYTEALYNCEKAVKIEHCEGRVYELLGDIFMETEQPQKALHNFELAFQSDKSNPDFALSLASVYVALFNFQKAHDFYQKAIALAIDDTNFWFAYLEFLIDESLYNLGFVLIETAREQFSNPHLDYAEAALLILSGKRQEGFLLLMQTLQTAFDEREFLFELAPALSEDPTVREWVELFSKTR